MKQMTEQQHQLLNRTMRQIGQKINVGVNYNINKKVAKDVHDYIFSGRGLMYHNEDEFSMDDVNKGENTVDWFDKNSAYPYQMLDKNFPLSFDYTICDDNVFEDDMTIPYVYSVEFEGYNKKFNGECNVFAPNEKGESQYEFENGKYYATLTGPRLKGLMLMYKFINLRIYSKLKFNNVGKLPFRDVIKELYEKKKNAKSKEERNNYKVVINRVYGCLIAQNKYQQKLDGWGAITYKKTGILSCYTCDYQFLEMAQMLMQYGDDVKYMDTDCIVLRSNRVFEENLGDKCGEYKEEYKGVNVKWFNWKKYVVYKGGKIVDKVFSGVVNVKDEEVNRLIKWGECLMETRDENGDKKWINVKDKWGNTKFNWGFKFNNGDNNNGDTIKVNKSKYWYCEMLVPVTEKEVIVRCDEVDKYKEMGYRLKYDF